MGGVGFGSVFASAIGFLVVLVDYGYFGLWLNLVVGWLFLLLSFMGDNIVVETISKLELG